jgi:Ran GTPase-activating protein (RanGAP) involved in mRNA processing and transport
MRKMEIKATGRYINSLKARLMDQLGVSADQVTIKDMNKNGYIDDNEVKVGGIDQEKIKLENACFREIYLPNAIQTERNYRKECAKIWIQPWQERIDAFYSGVLNDGCGIGVNTDEEYKQLKALLGSLKDNQTIKKLDILFSDNSGRGYSKQVVKMLAEIIKLNKMIKRIDMSVGMGDEGAEVIAGAIKENKTLSYISMYHCSIGDKGAKQIADALSVNSSITGVDLGINNICDEGAGAIAEMIKKDHKIVVLNLNRNRHIGNDAMKEISEALLMNTTMKTFRAQDSLIGDEGAKYLAKVIRLNKTIKYIDIAGNSIGDEGAKLIAEALKVNDSLDEINMWGNKITGVGQVYLQNVYEFKDRNHKKRILIRK